MEGVWSRNAPTLPITAVVQKAAAVVGAYPLIGLPCMTAVRPFDKWQSDDLTWNQGHIKCVVPEAHTKAGAWVLPSHWVALHDSGSSVR